MPRGQLSVITPPSKPTQRQNGIKFPLHTNRPSSAKQGQERDRFYRGSKRGRSSGTTSRRINSRSSHRHLDFAAVQALDPSRPGFKRYANSFPLDDLSNHTYSRDTDRPSFSDRLRSVFRREQSGDPGSSDSTLGSEAASVKKSGRKSTVYATIKLVIKLLKESSDAFPPLKSATGGLSAILNHRDARPISLRLWCPWCLQLS